MKSLLKCSACVRIGIVAALAAAGVWIAVRKPVLIAYHRGAMVDIWQTEHGISPRKGAVAAGRNLLGLPPVPANHQAAGKALFHREELLRLGFFAKRSFPLTPVSLATQEYGELAIKVAAQTGQQPTAQFEYDSPAAPSKVQALTVYAVPEDMPRWEQFIADLTTRHQ